MTESVEFNVVTPHTVTGRRVTVVNNPFESDLIGFSPPSLTVDLGSLRTTTATTTTTTTTTAMATDTTTTTEQPADDQLTVDQSTEPPVEPPTLNITRHVLRALGSCDTGIRQFRNAFPGDDPSIPVTEAVCLAHADAIDWEWAVGQMLNYDGQQHASRLRTSRSAENRRFGTGAARRASVFGHVFHHFPQYRSTAVIHAVRTADERADEQLLHAHSRLLRDLRTMRARVVDAENNLIHWRDSLIPNLERQIAESTVTHQTVLDRVAQRKIKASADDLKILERQFNERKTRHEQLVASVTAELEVE